MHVTSPDDPSDPHGLSRFVSAQATPYQGAIAEIKDGRKRSPWMWYIFPQYDGLGFSDISRRFSVKSVEAVLSVEGRSAYEIFGSPDDMKLKSCATLFACVSPAGSVYERLLDKYFRGVRDGKTLRLLEEEADS